MKPKVLFASNVINQSEWLEWLTKAFREVDLEVSLVTQADKPASLDYIITSPCSKIQDYSPYTNLRAVFNLWAGVENIIHNSTIQCPLVRMNDPGMVEGMVEWVTAQVLRHHLNMDIHITNADGKWLKDALPPLARSRTVGILGLGVLGSACAEKLSQFNFNVMGWSRTPKDLPNIVTQTREEGLRSILGMSDFLVLLIPLTPRTENIINEETLGYCKRGLVLINSGRGGLIDEEALLKALDQGQLSHATLDVFKQEPLPLDHPFWKHKKVSIWPHISSETRPQTGSLSIAENIVRDLKGIGMQNIVNFTQGY